MSLTANSASPTASLIAYSTVFVRADRRFSSLVPPASADLSIAFVERLVPFGPALNRLVHRDWFRKLVRVVERIVKPGISLHYAIRKLEIERIVREQLAAGVSHIVILAAGLDTLSARLHREFPDVEFIEVDLPGKLKMKRSILIQQQPLLPNLKFVECDLSEQEWLNTLQDQLPLCSGQRILFVAEGLLMYLRPDGVHKLLERLRTIDDSQAQLLFSFLEPAQNGRLDCKTTFKLATLWLALCGEPYRWGISREKLNTFLREHGFQLQRICDLEEIKPEVLNSLERSKIRLPKDEHIALAISSFSEP